MADTNENDHEQSEHDADAPPAEQVEQKPPTPPRPGMRPGKNGGWLYCGGVPGNRGGKNGGRPPSALRAVMREKFEERLPRLMEILDDPEAKNSDIKAVFDLLARYGIGTRDELTGADGAALAPVVIRMRREGMTRKIENADEDEEGEAEIEAQEDIADGDAD